MRLLPVVASNSLTRPSTHSCGRCHQMLRRRPTTSRPATSCAGCCCRVRLLLARNSGCCCCCGGGVSADLWCSAFPFAACSPPKCQSACMYPLVWPLRLPLAAALPPSLPLLLAGVLPGLAPVAAAAERRVTGVVASSATTPLTSRAEPGAGGMAMALPLPGCTGVPGRGRCVMLGHMPAERAAHVRGLSRPRRARRSREGRHALPVPRRRRPCSRAGRCCWRLRDVAVERCFCRLSVGTADCAAGAIRVLSCRPVTAAGAGQLIDQS